MIDRVRKAESFVGMGKPTLEQVINQMVEYEFKRNHMICVNIQFISEHKAFLCFAYAKDVPRT